MKEDEILILLFLHENPDSTTTEIAKNLFNNKIEQSDVADTDRRKSIELTHLRNQDRRVRYYVERFVGTNLVVVRLANRKKRYALNPDNVHLGIARIELITMGGDEVSYGLGRVLMCKVEGGINIEVIPETEVKMDVNVPKTD